MIQSRDAAVSRYIIAVTQRGFAFAKALAFVAVLLLSLVGGAAIYVETTWDNPIRTPARPLEAPQDARSIARGKYLYDTGLLCWTCHGTRGGHDAGEPQAGGKPFDLSNIGPGFGEVWGSNLTADPETGVGGASDGELVRAIREGIDRRGRVIFPVMAYQFYHDLGDDDALALVAYIRTLAPVRNPVPERKLSFAARALIALGQIKPEPRIDAALAAPMKGVTIEYGRYLTWHASGCAECHTPRFPNSGQLDRTRLLAGGLFAIPEEGFSTTAPNLTPDATTGLGRYTEADFMRAMRSGVRPDGTVMLPFMPWPTYAAWSEDDLRAVWLYLRSVPAVVHAVPSSTLIGPAASAAGAARGAGLYAAYCVSCHGDRGGGSPLTLIPLAMAARYLDDGALGTLIAAGPPGSRMPGFERTLTQDQLRDLIDFIRSWQPADAGQ